MNFRWFLNKLVKPPIRDSYFTLHDEQQEAVPPPPPIEGTVLTNDSGVYLTNADGKIYIKEV